MQQDMANQNNSTENSEQKKSSRLRAEAEKLRKQVRMQTIGYIVGALGLVAGLAWNDAIRALIDHFFPADHNSLPAKFVYAIGISLVVVFFSFWLVQLKGPEEDK